MNRRNAQFFPATRHWSADALADYLRDAIGVLERLADAPAGGRGDVVLDLEPLRPLVVWSGDNIREEIAGALRSWSLNAPAVLVQACKILIDSEALAHARIAVSLLVDAEFSRGETLAFAVAARHWSRPDPAEIRELGLALIHLCGLDAGAGSAMTMAARFADRPGQAASAFAEAAARVAADRTPSLLAGALDAVSDCWTREGVSNADANDFLDDIRLRIDPASLARALQSMHADTEGPVLSRALRLFGVKDILGARLGPGSAGRDERAYAHSTTHAVMRDLAERQGRRLPPPADPPHSGLALQLFHQAYGLDAMRPQGNA